MTHKPSVNDPASATPADSAGWVRRATRLSIGAPIAYRSAATAEWFRGTLVDISRSGVLFVPDSVSYPDPDLRLVIFLSRAALEAGGVAGLWPDLYCGGPVTRRVSMPDGRRAIAIRFDYDWPSPSPDEAADLIAEDLRQRH